MASIPFKDSLSTSWSSRTLPSGSSLLPLHRFFSPLPIRRLTFPCLRPQLGGGWVSPVRSLESGHDSEVGGMLRAVVLFRPMHLSHLLTVSDTGSWSSLLGGFRPTMC